MAYIKGIRKTLNEFIKEIIIEDNILINIIIFILSGEIDNSYILIKINDTGMQCIINTEFSSLPNEVYINEKKWKI